MANNKNKPVYSAEIWPVKAAVWRNQTNDGESFFYSTTVERTYKDGDEYKSTTSFNRDDLLPLAKCVDFCHNFILKQEAKERAEAKGGD